MADDDADPLDWELEQLQKLKRLAQAYGWWEDHSQYKAKLKGIQAQGKERLSAALRKKQGGGEEEGRLDCVGELRRVQGEGVRRGEGSAGEDC